MAPIPARRETAVRRPRWLALMTSLLVTIGALLPAALVAPPAHAADAFVPGDIYAIQHGLNNSAKSFLRVDPATGQVTNAGTLPGQTSSSRIMNALGISADGRTAFYVQQDYGNGLVRQVIEYDRATEQITVVNTPTSTARATHGAVDYRTGIYYFGGMLNYSNDPATIEIHAYNPATDEYLGLVARGQVPAGGQNGDWAFDDNGRLYYSAGPASGTSRIAVIDQVLPTTATQITVTATAFSSVTTNAQVGGLAFGGNGYLYVASTTTMWQVHPTSGAVLNSFSIGNNISDLASTSSPHTVTVQKDFPDGRARAGDQVTVSVTGGGITTGNTGTTSGDESGLQTDPSAQAGPITVLPGDTFSISETGTGADPDFYSSEWRCVETVTDRVVAEGTGSDGSFEMPRGSGGDGAAVVCTFTNRALTPGLSLVKDAELDDRNDNGAADVGETISYTFTVKNTGRIPLTDVRIDDSRVAGTITPESVERLEPGAEATFTARYTVTQADVDAGEVANTATATGAPPGEEPITSDPDTAVVPTVDAAPGISIVKSADKTELVVGETITYTFVVTNTGNVTLTDVTVDETEFDGAGELSEIVCEDGAASLAPEDQITCTATYEVQQADVDRGSVTNAATASGTPPGPDDPITSDPSEVTVPQEPTPRLEIVKSADREEFALGDTITYTFDVTNTGNVTLTDVIVDEVEFDGAGELSEIVCDEDAASLPPGRTATCTATYEVQQADVDRGSITNAATATGTPPGGEDPVTSDPSEVEVTADPTPGISIVKTADREEFALGDTVTYSFTVENTGNVTLTDVTVNEVEFDGAGELSEIVCGDAAASLAPGRTVTCTATYEVQQADVDRGYITNAATAAGTPPGGGEPVTSDPSEVEITADAAPRISIVKTADKSELVAGEIITYTFTVENTGNVTLTDVTVNETGFDGTGELSEIVCGDEAASLAPGRTVTCTATYEVRQADVDRGSLTNAATATGTPPGGEDPVTSDPSEVEIPRTAAPGISVVKTADVRVAKAGDTITYTFTITNTGNITLHDVEVGDVSFTGTGKLSEIVCPTEASSLAPGAQLVCTATYTVTEADARAGQITNVAVATGTPPGTDPPVTAPPSKVTVRIAPPTVLPVTGGQTDLWALTLAFSALLAGAVLVLTRRRRPRND